MMLDGHTVFALATGKLSQGRDAANPTVVGTAGAEVLARAIVRAVQEAGSRGGIPAAHDLIH
jgi:L-aminopeptidase/D-esterase-like protein